MHFNDAQAFYFLLKKWLYKSIICSLTPRSKSFYCHFGMSWLPPFFCHSERNEMESKNLLFRSEIANAVKSS